MIDIGDLYSKFAKQPRAIQKTEYWRGVKDFADFLLESEIKLTNWFDTWRCVCGYDMPSALTHCVKCGAEHL